MNTVTMEHECACFKKSEYESKQTFDTQKDAYNYTNTLIEFMNEDFCTTHQFVAQRTQDDNFIIQVINNPNAGSSCGSESSESSCSTGSCGC